MTQSNNILQELKELESILAGMPSGNMYSVPEGYFENLPLLILNKIKAMEASSASAELQHLSTILSNTSKEMPYSIPVGYFEGLAERVMEKVRESSDYQTAKEELESISPLLSGLKKEMPFSVPEGYFENIPANGKRSSGKLVSLTGRKWFRYAAAAIVTGVISITTFLIVNKQSSSPEIVFKKFEKKLDKELKKTSDKDLNEFVEYSDLGQELAFNQPKDEVKELLEDVPATELQKFLDEIADPEINIDEISSPME